MPPTTLDELTKQWRTLWPAAKGSLALVHKPCTRASCPACASGQKHAAYIFSFTEGNKRRCMYVPQPLVPTLKKYLANGRKLERLLYLTGRTLLLQHRKNKK